MQTWGWPGSSLDGPGWSISAEWAANLLFPALVPVLLGRSPRLAAAGAALALAVLVCSALLFGELFDVPAPGAVNTIRGAGALGRCVGEFALGMYCWRLRARVPALRALGQTGWQLGLLLGLALLMQDTRLDTLFVLACAAFLVGASFERSVVSDVLRSPPLAHLGRVSYSIYLLHVPLMPLRDALARLFAGLGAAAAWTAAVACCALATVGLATLSWRWVERPARAALLTLLAGGGRRPGGAPSVSPPGSAGCPGSAAAASDPRPGCW